VRIFCVSHDRSAPLMLDSCGGATRGLGRMRETVQRGRAITARCGAPGRRRRDPCSSSRGCSSTPCFLVRRAWRRRLAPVGSAARVPAATGPFRHGRWRAAPGYEPAAVVSPTSTALTGALERVEPEVDELHREHVRRVALSVTAAAGNFARAIGRARPRVSHAMLARSDLRVLACHVPRSPRWPPVRVRSS